jgi:hypothetical protein
MMPAGLLSPTLAVWPSGRRPGAFLHVGRSGDGEVCAAGRWPDLAAVRGARRGADLVAGMCGPVARWRVEWSSCERLGAGDGLGQVPPLLLSDDRGSWRPWCKRRRAWWGGGFVWVAAWEVV